MLFSRHLFVGSVLVTITGLASVIIFRGSIDFRLFFFDGVVLLVIFFSTLLTRTSTLSSLVSVTDSDSS